jgi:hypothetical protein
MVPVFVKHSFKYGRNVLYLGKFILTSFFILLNIAILAVILVLTYKVIYASQ